jgi:hypothetical protein
MVVADDGLLGVEDSGDLFRGRRRRRREKSRWRSRPQKDMMKKSRGERTRSEEIFRRSSSRRGWCCCCRELSREMLWSRTRRWETAMFAVARSGDCEIEGHSSEAVVVWRCCDLRSPFERFSVQTALLQEAVEREDVSGGVFDPGWLLADGCQWCGLPVRVEIMILLQLGSRRV